MTRALAIVAFALFFAGGVGAEETGESVPKTHDGARATGETVKDAVDEDGN